MVVGVFFQAEDGIRDAQESLGLGDVYKRQEVIGGSLHEGVEPGQGAAVDAEVLADHLQRDVGPVSYTHLTLPTIYPV